MTTPTPPAETVTALARRYRLEIDTSATGTPVWSLLPGVTEFAPKVEPTQQETTSYDAEGWVEQTVTMLAWSVEVTIAHRMHPTTGQFNPTQEHLRKASLSFGAASYVRLRYFDRGGADEAYEGQALVTWEPDGGGPDEVDSVKITLTGSGPLKAIANPVAPVPPKPAAGGGS
ncbi:phage tail tube protein [Streptomyces sp. NPDC021100]|uniref:phage tail tube protein n=1 Tax=Streptomyces sp. NPDC021100 TaxID=3365114 RepID=UPI00379F146F